MKWREYPFVRLLLPFICGILLAFFAIPPFGILRYPLFLFLFLAGLLFFTWRKQGYGRRWLFGLFAYLFFLTLGYQITYTQDDWNRTAHFRHLLGQQKHLAVGKVIALEDKGNRWVARLEMEALADSLQTWQECSGRLLAYVTKDSTITLALGDQLLFESHIDRILPPGNPAAFDFSRYMRVQNIYFQTFCRVADYRVLPRPAFTQLSIWMARQQNNGVEVLQKHLTDTETLGVGAALILGNRSGLDPEIKESYSQTGAMHVLAVSGLHVGMVAFLLSMLLKRIQIRKRYFEWFKIAIQIAGIWGFALLTGASPSVLRAAGMFTMLLLGIHLNRYSNIYNTLAASAFLLLCVRPFMFMELGFQLSYLAVLGIVYFQPRLYRLWYIPFPIGRWVWKLICVSLAAQITTLPISLYYFHQFPVYFWLSGLVVVPAAMLILPLGLALLASSKLTVVSLVLGKFLLWIIIAVNMVISSIQNLPGHLITGIWITGFTLCLLYLIVASIVLRLELKQRRWLHLTMGLIFVIGLQNSWQQWHAVNQRQIVFYQIYQHTALDFIDGRESFTLVDNELAPEKLERANQYFHWSKRVNHSELHRLQQNNVKAGNWMYQSGFIQFYGLRLAVLEEQIPPLEEPIAVDYLLIRNNPDLDINALLQSFRPGQLVFDASNQRLSVERWKSACRKLDLPFYDLNEDGALVIEVGKRS